MRWVKPRAEPESPGASDGTTDSFHRALRSPESGPTAAVLAVVSGACWAGIFEPWSQPWLLVPALAFLLAATRGQRARRAAWLGWLAGWIFMLGLLRWNAIVGADGWIGLAAIQGAFFAVLGASWALLQRSPWWPVTTAAAWVAVEALRSTVPFGGFPWGRLAYGLVDTPLAHLGRLGGPALVAFMALASAAALLAAVVRGWRREPGVALLLVAAVGLGGVGWLVPTGLASPTGQMLNVVLVQGGVPGDGFDPFAEERAVLDNHVRATNRLGGLIGGGSMPKPDVVIWPENSSDIDPFGDAAAHREIGAAVRAVGVPVIVGALVDVADPGRAANTSIVWRPDEGPTRAYVKRHPVPFGEYLPFRDVLSRYIERFEQVSRDFVRGSRSGAVEVSGARLGLLICFEVAYEYLSYDLIDAGAEILIVQTNNATWARQFPMQLEQQFEITRYRAIETGRHVVVASTNGISGVISPSGEVIARLPIDQSGTMPARLGLADGMTLGVRLGSWVTWFFAVVAVVALLRQAWRPSPDHQTSNRAGESD